MPTFECNHCGKPISDEYPTNYFVTINDDAQEWVIHVDCYPEWFVQDIAINRRRSRVVLQHDLRL
jgi:hypothetical protein